jgi:hypothetical protein
MTAPLPAPAPVQARMHHDLLTLAYPAITITCHHHTWRKPRWEVVRKNNADPGLYTIVTPDLDELAAVLAATITITIPPAPPVREANP